MRVGFTGTRKGMTAKQRRTFLNALKALKPRFFHHGDCIGADARASEIAALHGVRIISHPCTIKGMRAFTDAEETREPKPPLDRNKDIVNECDIIIAAPEDIAEIRRSGTWSTVRYAESKLVPVILLRP